MLTIFSQFGSHSVNLAQFFKVTKVTFMTFAVQNSVDYSMNIP